MVLLVHKGVRSRNACRVYHVADKRNRELISKEQTGQLMRNDKDALLHGNSAAVLDCRRKEQVIRILKS